MNPWAITDTYSLIGLIQKFKKPASYLLDTLFPEIMPVATTSYVAVEYEKGHRRVAPFVVKGSKGVNVARDKTQVKLYNPPLIGARRVISLQDIETHLPGEQPAFSTMTPEDRAAQVQARDLIDLQDMVRNRKAAMAAELLIEGKVTIRGYADDGLTVQTDVIESDTPAPITKNWTAASADIYGDLRDASDTIQEEFGSVPTLMICGKNIESYMLKNNFLKQFMFSNNAAALAFLNLQPKYLAPQVRPLGYIGALNLTLLSYLETYTDDDGQVKPFIPPDTCLICVPGSGRQLLGSITLMQNNNWVSYAAEQVPMYSANEDAQTTSLTLYSRFLPIPIDSYSWITLRVGGN